MNDQSTETISEKLTKEFICRYGIPHSLHSDQGTNFESSIFQSVMKYFGINKTRTTPYYPQSNGLVERFNKTLVDMLAKVVSDNTEWDAALPMVLASYRNTVHGETGFTPNQLMFGRNLNTLGASILECTNTFNSQHEYMRKLSQQINTAYRKVEEYYKKVGDKNQVDHHNVKTFNPEDIVWIRKQNRLHKLDSFWSGPYKIRERLDDTLYKVDTGEGLITVNHYNLKYQPHRLLHTPLNDNKPEESIAHESPPTKDDQTNEITTPQLVGKRMRKQPAWMQDYIVNEDVESS